MAWNDSPTNSQLDMIFYWSKWSMPTDDLRRAVKWLEENATRGDVSKEMSRIRDLYRSHKLDKESFFDSRVWQDYEEGGIE